MRTKSEPFQSDDRISTVIAMDLPSLSSNQNVSEADSSTPVTAVANNTKQTQRSQRSITKTCGVNNDITKLNSCQNKTKKTVDKSTQKDFNLDEQVQKRMRELGTSIIQHEFAHRQELLTIQGVQRVNFELHHQNAMLRSTISTLQQHRKDSWNRQQRQQRQRQQHSIDHQEYIQMLRQHQQQQQQYQQEQQQQHQQQQHQQQQHMQQEQQYCSQQQQQVDSTTNLLSEEQILPDIKREDTAGANNNTVFVTEWDPNAESVDISEQTTTIQNQQQCLQQQLQQQTDETTHNISSTKKLSHRGYPSMPPPLSPITNTNVNGLTPQEHQMWHEFYRPNNSVRGISSVGSQPNQHHQNNFVTPPPSPMCSLSPTSTASAHQASMAHHYPASPTYYPDAESPSYYYIQQRRHHPY